MPREKTLGKVSSIKELFEHFEEGAKAGVIHTTSEALGMMDRALVSLIDDQGFSAVLARKLPGGWNAAKPEKDLFAVLVEYSAQYDAESPNKFAKKIIRKLYREVEGAPDKNEALKWVLKGLEKRDNLLKELASMSPDSEKAWEPNLQANAMVMRCVIDCKVEKLLEKAAAEQVTVLKQETAPEHTNLGEQHTRFDPSTTTLCDDPRIPRQQLDDTKREAFLGGKSHNMGCFVQ